MDRTGKIAVALSLIILVAWMVYSDKENRKAVAAHAAVVAEEEAARAKEAAEAPPTSAAATPAVPGAAAAANPEAAPGQPAVAEKLEELSTASSEYAFTNLGGGISRVILKKHEAEKGKPMVLNEFSSVPIGTITEAAGEGTNVPFTAKVDASNGEVIFERTDARQVQLTKRFVVTQETGLDKDYIVQLEATFTNKGAQPVTLPGYFIHTGGSTPVHEKDLATYTGFKWAGGKLIEAHAFDGGMFKTARPVIAEVHPEITWAGVVNQYFTTIVAPRVEGPNVAQLDGKNGVSIWAKRFDVTFDMWKEAGRTSSNPELKHFGVNGALGMPGFTLEPGKSVSQKFQIYTGPREYGRLRLLANDQAEIMDFGMFGFVSKTLLNTMNWIHGKVGTYAAAIILLTLLIKTLLWPLQNKATQSMKRMQLLAPLQTELREKYKDDPTRMNSEVMKLYKDYGVNPLSGCLPMLVQIPIFFGFYNMLGKAVELRNSKFLWVHDLSQPDTIWHFPGVGWPLNVLPLLMAGTMLWQMSLSPKSGDPMQQRIFMFMPLIFIAFCYNFASALALYWTVQNLFSVVQLYATRNQAPPTLAKVTAPSKRK